MASVVPHKYLSGGADIAILDKWMVFKAAYPNSVIYDYKALRCQNSGRLPYCANTISKAVKAFVAAGLAHHSGTHVILTAKRTLHKMVGGRGRGAWLKTDPNQDNKLQLRYALIQTKFNQVRYACLKRGGKTSKRPTLTQRLFAKKPVKSSLAMSYSALADLLACSRYKARKTLKDLKTVGALDFTSRQIRVALISDNRQRVNAYLTHLRANHKFGFYHAGRVMTVLPTKIVPKGFPVTPTTALR